MVDTSAIDDLDPFEAMDAECARLEAFFRTLDDAGWDEPTRCEGWRRREMIAHLMGAETYNRACLADELSGLFAKAAEAGATDMDAFNAWTVALQTGRDPRDVLDDWVAANAAVRAEMRSRGRDGTMTTSVGPYPVALQAFHLASEYATHADDMGIGVGDHERASRLDWRKRFSVVAVAEAGKPATIEPTAAGNVVRAQGAEAVLSDADLVEAVSARLPDDHPLDETLRSGLRALA